MALASKWMDMVVGVDFHLEIAPPSPTPVPFPHPFVGIIWDPLGYLVGEVFGAVISLATFNMPKPSGPVLVNSMMGTVTGDETEMPGGHIVIPPGVSWSPVPRVPVPVGDKKPAPEPPAPPPADAMLLFGSKTVEFRGSKAVRVGETALTCSDPVRLPTGVVLPTSVSPNLVLVGGPPAVDWMMLLMSVGMKALRNKWTSDLLHGAVNKISDKLGLPKEPGRFRQVLHDGICFVTGHPVNVANGCLFTEWTDFELPGPIPLEFSRRYRSGFCDRDSPLGHGWSHSLDQKLWIEPSCIVYLTEDGRELEFDTFDLPDRVMRKGGSLYDPINRLTLRCLGQFRWEIESHDGIVKELGPIAGESSQNRDRGMARLTRIRDRVGDEIRFAYDERAQLAEVIDSGGRRIVLEYDRDDRLKHLWLPAANGDGMRQHAHFLYSDDGDLIEARDAAGKPVRFEYDRHLMVRETNRNGMSFYFAYDGWGSFARCVRTWGDGGLLDHVLRYDRENRRTLVTNSLGHTTVYEMDGLGLVTKVVAPRGGTTRYEYDEALRKTAVIDPLGNETRFTYDDRGNQIKVRGADGAVTTTRYDELNNLIWLRTPKGSEWRWTYDRWGRVSTRVDPLGQVTRFSFEGRRLIAVVDPASHRTTLGYDSAGNIVAIGYPDGTQTAARYDALGRPIALVDVKGNIQRRTYDAQGWVVRIDEPDSNIRVFEHDAEGNLLRARDRLRDFQFTYYGMGKVASRAIGGTTVRLEYDTEQQLTAVINEKGYAYRFERDAAGNTRAEFGFDQIRRLYDRDAAGRVTKVFRPGIRNFSTFEYDAAGRTTKVEHSDGSSEHFAYDADGALVQASNNAITVRMERDAFGRIVKEWQGEAWVASEYDYRGERVGVETSLGLRKTIQRNAMGDVVGIVAKQWEQTWSAEFRRDAFGLEVERLLPGEVQSQWFRDAVGRPTIHLVGKRKDPARGLIRERRYTWGANDRLLEIAEDGDRTQRFDHDPRGYLTATTYGNGQTALRMPDEVGNVFETRARSDRQYGPSGELWKMHTTTGVRIYYYNAEGNLERRADPDGREWRYFWNGAGWLTQVKTPNGDEVTFAYDALGRRTEKQSKEGRTRWVWDQNILVHEESKRVEKSISSASHRIQESEDVTWIFDEDEFAPLAQLNAHGSRSIICDHRQVPICTIDHYRNDPQRDAKICHDDGFSSGIPISPWGFAGQYRDDEIGLYYNRFRYYDPVQGQYVSQDPIGLLGGTQLYSYTENPQIDTDPFGLTSQSSYIKPGSGPRKIDGTRGLLHSFDRHAKEWFGGAPGLNSHLSQWKDMIKRAAESRKQVNWITGDDPTVGHLARIDGKYFFVQFYKTGPRAGEIATAFAPQQHQLASILRLLGK